MEAKPLIFFGGAEGAGKTTCAAAAALRLSSSGLRTLVITSDSIPSLSRLFGTETGDGVREIGSNLRAIEMSRDTVLKRWKKKFGPFFYDVLSYLIDMKGLDGEAGRPFLDYIGSAPSLQEETMLDLIGDMAESRRV
ncbi:MAG: hypothetical protein M1497_02005 [Nitrospirae bacterium]|nr:hypothetical protein [Nitrospirota bacterium]